MSYADPEMDEMEREELRREARHARVEASRGCADGRCGGCPQCTLHLQQEDEDEHLTEDELRERLQGWRRTAVQFLHEKAVVVYERKQLERENNELRGRVNELLAEVDRLKESVKVATMLLEGFQEAARKRKEAGE